ncbi:uncharacterized protein HKW66_Vig0048190 [Vigna angularis]|uniref:Uncharacterized protein n=1 Tax=Phaseolus angularis TaxID=3914 RepID=A0A8T0L0Z0_PHAAN|nr:uncharacterized protein HKW66_Vig0048190 [Vigna angularis]
MIDKTEDIYINSTAAYSSGTYKENTGFDCKGTRDIMMKEQACWVEWKFVVFEEEVAGSKSLRVSLPPTWSRGCTIIIFTYWSCLVEETTLRGEESGDDARGVINFLHTFFLSLQTKKSVHFGPHLERKGLEGSFLLATMESVNTYRNTDAWNKVFGP